MLTWLARIVFLILLLAAVLFGIAQTPWAKRHLAAALSARLSKPPERRVTIGTIRGVLPFRVQLDRFGVSDQAGEWLAVNHVQLRWSPWALVHRRVEVAELTARQIDLVRLPARTQEHRDETAGIPSPAAIVDRITRLPSITVHRLAIGRLVLAEAMTGQAATFRARGGVTGALGPAVSLSVERLDGPRTRMGARMSVKGDPAVLTVDVRLEEAPGGFLAALVRVPEEGRLDVALAGKGPLADWQGHLGGTAWGLGEVDAAVTLAEAVDYMLGVEGVVRIDPALLPEKAAPLVAGESRLALAVRYEPSKALAVERLNLEGGFGAVRMTGRLDTASEQLEGSFSWELGDLARLESLAGAPLGGGAEVTGTVSGTLDRPLAELEAVVKALRVDTVHAQRLAGSFQLASLGPLKQGYAGVRVGGRGTLAQLAVDDAPDMPEPNLEWTVQLDAPLDAPIAIEALALEGEQIRVALSGEVDPAGPSGTVDAVVEIHALRRLAELLGVELDGAATIRAQLTGDAEARSLEARIEGQVNGLTGLPDAITAALGESVAITGNVSVDEGERVTVTDLVVDGAATLTGKGSIRLLEDRQFQSGWRLALADLSVMDDVLGRPVSGALEIDGTTAGTFERFEATVDARGTGLSLGSAELREAVAHVEARGLPADAAGTLSLELDCADGAVNAVTRFALADHHLNVPDLTVHAPGIEVTATLTIDMDRRLLDGAVQGHSEDLARLAALAEGVFGDMGTAGEVKGSGTFGVRLASAEDRQDVAVELGLSDVAAPFGQVRDADVQGEFQDILGALSGRVVATLEECVVGRAALEQLEVSASGDLDRVAFAAHARGLPYTPFVIDTEGSVVFSEADQRLELAKLEGNYKEYPFVLIEPAVVRRGEDTYVLEGLAGTFGSGRIDASGRYGPDELDVTCGWQDLPLEAGHLVGFGGLSGDVAGTLRVTGTSARPRAEARLRVTEIIPAGESFESVPPMTLTGEGTLDADRCQVTLDLEGLVDEPIHARAVVPVEWSLAPVTFAVPRDGPLEAHLVAQADLARVGDLLLLDEHRIVGMLTVSFDLAGTVAAPQLDGQAVIEDGAYEYERSGTVLRDIAVELVAKGTRLELVRAEATDGGKGRIAATGRIDLDPDAAFPFSLDLRLDDARLVRHDDVTALVGGGLDLAGTSDAATLGGALTIYSADIQVPERTAAIAPALDVVEINAPGGEEHQQEHDYEQEHKIGLNPEPRTLYPTHPAPAPSHFALRTSHGQRPIYLGEWLTLDVDVDVPGRVFVRAPNFTSEWQGAFNIGGQVAEPAVAGALSAVRGRLLFLNRRFTLATSSVALDGRYPPAPQLNVALETRARDLTARLRLAGTASAPEVTLTSEPPLPQDEILARLLFGKDLSSISPMRAYQLAEAAKLLSGAGGAFGFLRQTRRTFGFDEFELTQSDEGGKGAALSAGKYLGEKLYVEMQKDLGETGGRVSVEAEIMPNVTVESEVGSDAQGGVWLQWERDY